MSSSFGELVGLCHFRHNHVTPAFSSSGGKGGNGTLQEVNRSTTSLNSLETQKMKIHHITDTQQTHHHHHLRSNLVNAQTSHPCRFLLRGGRRILKLVKAWWLYTASEVHSSTVRKSPCLSPATKRKSSVFSLHDFRQFWEESMFLINKMTFVVKLIIIQNSVKMITIIKCG